MCGKRSKKSWWNGTLIVLYLILINWIFWTCWSLPWTKRSRPTRNVFLFFTKCCSNGWMKGSIGTDFSEGKTLNHVPWYLVDFEPPQGSFEYGPDFAYHRASRERFPEVWLLFQKYFWANQAPWSRVWLKFVIFLSIWSFYLNSLLLRKNSIILRNKFNHFKE